MATLPTNFKDDILDTSVNTRRKYRMYENTDGTIELEDVTEYSQVGDEFGAGQINSTNTEVNKKFDKNMLVRNLDTINAITKEGYAPDALALKEVTQSLQNIKIFPDFTEANEIMSKTNGVTSFELQENCFVHVQINASSNLGISILVNDIAVTSLSVLSGIMLTFPPFICKKGDVISVNVWDGTPYDWFVKTFSLK